MPPPKLLPASTHTFTLKNAAFPADTGHPSVLVYVPANFNPAPPIAVIVYIHGWYNCILVCTADTDAPCSKGGPNRNASHLISQFEAAKKNALLVVPEVKYDFGGGDPGNLGNANGLKLLLDETLALMAPTLGALQTKDIARLTIASHSGGYIATADMASKGGAAVQEIWLLDSLYGEMPAFKAWISSNLGSFAGEKSLRRFFDVYTDNAGTLANSQAFAKDIAALLPAGATSLTDDKTTATWSAAAYHKGLLFKHSALSHDGVTEYYFGQLVASDLQLAERP